VYGLPAVPDGPTCLNVVCNGRGRGGTCEAVDDVDALASGGCSGVGGTMVIGDESDEIGFDTGDSGAVGLSVAAWFWA